MDVNEFIIQNHSKMTYSELAKACNCSYGSIKQRVKRLLDYGKLQTKVVYDKVKTLEGEYWVNLKDFNASNYYISNFGRIKNNDDVLIKYRPIKRGYIMVKLFLDDCTYKHFLVHRLMALIFIPNDDPQNKTEVNHKDGNKENYNINNLEWVTPEENLEHAYETGLHKSKYTKQDIIKVCELLQEGKTCKEIETDCKYDLRWINAIYQRKHWKHISMDYNW